MALMLWLPFELLASGASQPSRDFSIYLFMSSYPGAAHTVMFYVLLNMRVGSRIDLLSPYRNVLRNSK